MKSNDIIIELEGETQAIQFEKKVTACCWDSTDADKKIFRKGLFSGLLAGAFICFLLHASLSKKMESMQERIRVKNSAIVELEKNKIEMREVLRSKGVKGHLISP